MENGLSDVKETNCATYDSFKLNVTEHLSFTSPQPLDNNCTAFRLSESNTAPSSNSSAEEELYFEGCGLEGSIKCIFLCEFHPIAGPKITCQVSNSHSSRL